MDNDVDIISPHQRTASLEDIFKLKFINNLTFAEIGIKLGVPKSTVHAKLQRFLDLLPNAEEIQNYRKQKQYYLDACEYKIIEKLLDSETIKSASLNNAAYAFNTVYNSNRLERGLSTQATDINILMTDAGLREKRLTDLRKIIDVPCTVQGVDNAKVGNEGQK